MDSKSDRMNSVGKVNSPTKIERNEFHGKDKSKLRDDLIKLAKNIKSANPTPKKAKNYLRT